jgi:putative transposase
MASAVEQMIQDKVNLTEKERQQLINLTRRGKSSARQLTRARVLLLSDEKRKNGPMTDSAIKEILAVSVSTIHRIRQQFRTEGLAAALEEKPRSGRPKRFLGRDAATVTALACSTPPEGYAKWSLRLLADKAVELEYLDSISHQTVFNMLKKTNFHLT